MMKSRKISLRMSHRPTILVSVSLYLKPFACCVKDTGNIPKSFGCWQSEETLGKLTSQVRALGQCPANNFEPSCCKDFCPPKKPPNCCSSPEIIPDYFRIDWKREVICSLASIPSRPECLWILHMCAQIAHKLGKKGWCCSHHLIKNSQHWILPSISWRKFPVERVQEWAVQEDLM